MFLKKFRKPKLTPPSDRTLIKTVLTVRNCNYRSGEQPAGTISVFESGMRQRKSDTTSGFRNPLNLSAPY